MDVIVTSGKDVGGRLVLGNPTKAETEDNVNHEATLKRGNSNKRKKDDRDMEKVEKHFGNTKASNTTKGSE